MNDAPIFDIRQGDSRELIKSIPDASIDMILTDPPYNLGKYSTGNIKMDWRKDFNNDLAAWDQLDFEPAFWLPEFQRILKPTGNIFAFTSYNLLGKWHEAFDPVFDTFSHGPELAALATDLGLAQPQVWQSMVIFKQPHIGGEVGWHQDASFFVTDPVTVTTFWFALEDATLDNGCLWVQGGGHRSPLRERYVCEGGNLHMQALDPTPWPGMDGATPVPVAAGTLVCFHGLLPHCSAPNRSAQSRLAYTLHVTDGTAAYSPLNWLQASPALPVRGFI